MSERDGPPASDPARAAAEPSRAGGAALRTARQQAGFTLADLAEMVGVSAATLSRVETGRGRPSAELLVRCAAALGLDATALDAAAEVLDADGRPRETTTPGLFVPGEPQGWRRYGPLELEPGLHAAVSCFTEFGYHGTSVRDLARVARMSVPALYNRFPSKQSVLYELMLLIMEDLLARCRAAQAEGATAADRFTLLVECIALFHTYRRELAFLGASEMRSLEPQNRRIVAGMRTACQRMVDAEAVQLARQGRLGTDHPEDAARAVVTMLVGIANWYRSDGALTPEEIAQRYVGYARSLVGLRDAESS